MIRKTFTHLLIALAFISAIVVSCKKEEKITPPAQKSTIITVKDSLMGGGGVRLFGLVTPDAQITDYGFEYGEDSLFVKTTKISLGTTVKANFYTDILAGLITGHKYFFRAYENLAGTEKRGFTLSFLSQGSKPIIITRVSPATAGMGDTVTIHGKYFDVKKTNVYFDMSQAARLSISDSVITCVIPYLPQRYNNGLSLKDTDNNRYTSTTYQLAAPIITSFSDKKFIGDTVTIIGDHFDRVVNFATEVDFGTVKARIILTSKNKMVVVVPTIYNAPVSIKVVGQFQSTTAVSQFVLAAPVITQISPSANTLDFLTISGNNFFPDSQYDYNQVFVNGVKADIYTATRTSIKIRIPEAPYPNRTASISVKVLGQTVNYSGTVNITDKWLMIANNLPFASPFVNGSFVVNNVAYYLAPVGGRGDFYVYKYDAASNTWSQYQQLTQLGGNVQGVRVVNSKAYIYSAASGGSFWQYDPASKQLVAAAAFPGGARNVPTMFSVGSIVYMGFGVDVGAFNDFYAYNTLTNTWKPVSSFNSPYFDGVTGSFVSGTKGYIVFRTYNGNWLEQYDTQTDSWTAKAPVVNAYNMAIGFTLNSMGYICGVSADNYSNNCFQYNPTTDTWTQKPIVGVGRYNAARSAFTLGSKSYLITTESNGTAATLYSADWVDLQ
jgi:hypothetical protein